MFVRANLIEQAQVKHPGAAVYVRVRGGFMAFDYPSEYMAWKAGR